VEMEVDTGTELPHSAIQLLQGLCALPFRLRHHRHDGSDMTDEEV